jgi:uncharacterized repeat protein (TIGR03803 family)
VKYATSLAQAAMLVFVLNLVFAQTAGAQSYTLTTLYSFTGSPDGDSPIGIVLDSEGNLYGSTQYGGLPHCGPVTRPATAISCGTVFKLDTSGQETVLYRFTFANGDGMMPFSEGSVMRDSQGNLYGTTFYGGDRRCFFDGVYYGCGIVFKLDPSGQETVLHIFKGAANGDGGGPTGRLVQDGIGNLYGTTMNGGDARCTPHYYEPGCGTVFKVDTAGHETVLHKFTGGNVDGEQPSGLVIDGQGNLYGTTIFGGSYGYGTVFKVDASGHETVLYNFRGAGAGDGASPLSGLTRDAQGNLYGTTNEGGTLNCFGALSPGCGTVFKLSASGQETVLYRFTGSNYDGYPHSTLVLDNAGNLYGIGGTDYFGVIFKLDASGHESVLYSFSNIEEPAELLAIPGQPGSFYGALYVGDNGGPGGIFKLAPTGQ